MVENDTVSIRAAQHADLVAINTVVEAAVMSWSLPERVKRLVLPTYRYQEHDLDHFDIMVAIRAGGIIGVVACEPAATRDAPPGKRALLLHGLYVLPGEQSRGIGTRLLNTAQALAHKHDFDGLLVKAQADAEGFFQKQGMARLPVDDPKRDFERRYWLEVR